MLNDPLQSLVNRDYISEKLTAHRQQIIDTYGSSKVPTPVVKDVYKQCRNAILSDVKELSEVRYQQPEQEREASGFVEQEAV